MLLTSAATTPEDDAADGVLVRDEACVAEDLAFQVRSTFPDLRFTSATVEERGGDHRVLLLDATYAFRFPRDAGRDLGAEIAVLRALRGRCEIAIPEYTFVDPAGRFAGYRFIAGDELTPRRFAALPIDTRHRVLDQAGGFLATLHALAPERILAAARWPRLAPVGQQAANARARHLPAIAAAFPPLARLIDAFYDRCAEQAAVRQIVLHGDLVDDHLLLALDGQRLAGIIDFGDVALGDPAQDLLGFWAYGAAAVARVIAAYGAAADPELQERSRRAFVCYRIDRFADLFTSGGAMTTRSAAELTTLLSAGFEPALRHSRT